MLFLNFMSVYDDNYYKQQKNSSILSAKEVVPIILDFVKVKSVVDFGCGIGTWLNIFEKYGCEILGIDNHEIKKEKLMINNKFFLKRDLPKKINLNRKFDLAISLEVLEHI